jgi:hypothetical protein
MTIIGRATLLVQPLLSNVTFPAILLLMKLANPFERAK